MKMAGESETIDRTAANSTNKKYMKSVWSDVPRRLVTVCVGIPFVWKLLERPTTAYVFFFGAHAISAWEYSLLEPSITTTTIYNVVDVKQCATNQPSSEILSKPMRLLFCLTSIALASIPDSSALLFSFAVSLAAGSFAVANRHHWIIGLLVVTVPFRAWCNLVYQFENSENSMNSSFASTIAVLLTVWNADTGALVVGRLFGRKNTTVLTGSQVSNTNRLPLWVQRISPAKTVEGFLGGIMGGIGTAIWLVPLLLNRFSVDTSPGYRKLWGLDGAKNDEADSPTFAAGVGIPNRFILGFCLSVLAILGDLVESSIKRRSRSKDSGSVLPGHGGILDRFDSSLLAVLFYRAVLEYATSLVSEVDDTYYPTRSITGQGNIEL